MSERDRVRVKVYDIQSEIFVVSTVFDCRGALARVEGLFNPATSDLVTGR